jgi:hypothetical protein
LFNLVEQLASENDKLRIENQALRDENARLKGEQGQLHIRGRNPTDISSEKEHQSVNKAPKAKGSRNSRLTITRTETVAIDRPNLPADAVAKGYDPTIGPMHK